MNISARKAFTLIELLVVIAIIAVLLSVLLPSLRAAKQQAQRVVCGANLSQIGKALEAYEMENDYKRFSIRGGGATTDEYWMGQLAPYLSDDHYAVEDGLQTVVDAFMCISAPASKYEEDPASVNPSGYWGTSSSPWEWKRSTEKSTLGSYTINGWICYDMLYDTKADISEYMYRNWTSVSSNVPIFADGIWPVAWPKGTDLPPTSDLQGCVNVSSRNAELDQRDEMRRVCIDRHRGQVLMLYKDLHTEPIELEMLWQKRWHRNYQVPAASIVLPNR